MTSTFHAVAIGDAPGVYATDALAAAGVGAHALPLRLTCEDEDKARAFVARLAGVRAVVYTDGACSKNGKPDARAGVGVYWGPDHARNVSRRVLGDQTNNVAEMEAIECALDAIAADADLVAAPVAIVSDSSYCINCLTIWHAGFVRRGWKTASGGDVHNRALITRVKTKLDSLPAVRLVHVRGHVGHAGNHAADALAVAGAKA